ncbi:MAG TPA: nucleotidyltransferase family protein, partial [Acetomicrobium flavidum]|nr:nucleotidyltransferase family protein [Acetomicrobium flavidum]
HPLLIPRSLIEAIRRAPINFTLKDLMPPPEDRILISVDDEGVALDVDTPDDLQRAEILLKARLKGLT